MGALLCAAESASLPNDRRLAAVVDPAEQKWGMIFVRNK
jgi:hypothetical protein